MEPNDLRAVFVKDYLGTMFYFYLKKTGNSHDAEDLTQEAAFHILHALAHGTVPTCFSAWVWQIARNRYRIWATRKNRDAQTKAALDIADYEIPDAELQPATVIEKTEQLALLRRELAFIRSDYRQILLAYYSERKKVGEIAHALSLPPGTVMSKLYRARNTLKEGLDMAREFGKRSYHPEQLRFCASGNQPSGLPWCAVERKIPVNILAEANNNPCTIEELALSLGIAVPYMEEEVALLVRAELLKKTDADRYLTNFFISPVECQNEVNALCCDFAEKHADEIFALGNLFRTKTQNAGAITTAYPENDVEMFFAFRAEQALELSVLPRGIYFKPKRADGGNWGFFGMESGSVCRLPRSFFSNNGMGDGKRNWIGYQCEDAKTTEGFSICRYATHVPSCHLLPTLQKIAQGTDPQRLNETEPDAVAALISQKFCLTRADGTLYVNAILCPGQIDEEALTEQLSGAPAFQALHAEMAALVRQVRSIIETYSNPYLKSEFDYAVAMSLDLRALCARLWKDRGLYRGNMREFCEFCY